MKKLGVSSWNEVQILKATLNKIKIRMSSVEAGAHPNISKVHISIQDIMTVKLEEEGLDQFGNELQTQVVPALEVISVKIQQLELNQAKSIGSINLIIPPPIVPVVSSLKALEDWVKADLTSLAANVYYKSLCMKGWWFRSLDNCVLFSQKYIPEVQFQCFLDVVSYLQFVKDKIIDIDTYQSSKNREARVQYTAEPSVVIASFWTSVPPVFTGPKESCDSR